MDRPLLIFSGQSNRPLAQAIAEALGLPLGKSTTLRFANDNLFVRYEESLREGDVFIVQSFVPPVQDHLMELLMMVDAAKGRAPPGSPPSSPTSPTPGATRRTPPGSPSPRGSSPTSCRRRGPTGSSP